MLRIVKGFTPWILFDCFEEKFYIRWTVGRSPRVHEVNPGRDPSLLSLDFVRLELNFVYPLTKPLNRKLVEQTSRGIGLLDITEVKGDGNPTY